MAAYDENDQLWDLGIIANSGTTKPWLLNMYGDFSVVVPSSSPPAGWANKVNGVTNANIGKVNGVAIANISKVNGVS